MLSNEIAKVMI